MHLFLNFISDIIWNSMLVYLITGIGMWFTWRTGFIQFRYILSSAKYFLSGLRTSPDGISTLQALCLSLAGRMGSGNIVGVAIAIIIGGPGALFWMWIAALLSMALSFAECTLAQLYKARDASGQFRGGPAWYMERGLGMRWMGVLFSLLLLLGCGLVYNAVQSSALIHAFNYAFGFSDMAIACVLAALSLAAFMCGMRRIARISLWVVPFMGALWLGAALVVMVLHIDKLPAALGLVLSDAFSWQEMASGALGYSLSHVMTIGFERALFACESGVGSTPNAAAAAAPWPPHPAVHGIVQMLGGLFDTLLICTASAIIVLLAGIPAVTGAGDAPFNGVVFVQQAMSSLLGSSGPTVVALVLGLFAFTSIVTNYIYAENCLFFLRIATPWATWLLRFSALAMVLAGAVFSVSHLSVVADVITALIVIVNLTAILLLSPTLKTLAEDYLRQRWRGEAPVFDAQHFPEIVPHLAARTWGTPAGKNGVNHNYWPARRQILLQSGFCHEGNHHADFDLSGQNAGLPEHARHHALHPARTAGLLGTAD